MPQSISLGFQIVCASGKNRYRRLRQQGRVNQKSPQDLKLEHIRRHREYLDKVQYEQEEEEEEEQQEDAAHNHRLREVVNDLKEHSAAAAATIDVADNKSLRSWALRMILLLEVLFLYPDQMKKQCASLKF
eukprot:jgi/Picre1/32675/NNA_008021.t1